jgi:glycosyltransferase involved in cell wall biosynthesis
VFDRAPVRITVIVPVRDAMQFLPLTVASLLEAASNTEGVELIYVDNGSTDGSYEYLRSIQTGRFQVQLREEVSISALRNLGASQARGEFLSFLDADCSIGPYYFEEALGVLRSSKAAATGCDYEVPPEPHWIEATWHSLHHLSHDCQVGWMNAGNFFITREAFEDVGGFREDLRTGEDAEIGQRLTNAGYTIHSASAVSATHLGNPKSLRHFYRRSVWHGLGMFGTVNRHRIDKPTAMMFAHLFATIGGLVALFGSSLTLSSRLLIALLLQLVVPALTVAYRFRQTRRTSRIVEGITLYWLYYWARLQALALVFAGRSGSYVK